MNKPLTLLQINALAALRDGTWQAFPTLQYQGIRWRTLDSLHGRGLVDRDDDREDRVFRFRINESGRDAHYRRQVSSSTDSRQDTSSARS